MPFFLLFVLVVIGFNQATYTVREDAGSVTVSVSVMSGTISQDVIITLSTVPGGIATGGIIALRSMYWIHHTRYICATNSLHLISPAGSDYTPVTTDLTFNSINAAIPQTVTIPILDDLLLEGFEVFNVTLTTNNSTSILLQDSNVTLYIQPDLATVTIEDWEGK